MSLRRVRDVVVVVVGLAGIALGLVAPDTVVASSVGHSASSSPVAR